MTHIKTVSALKAQDDWDSRSCVIPEGSEQMVDWLAVLGDPSLCVKEVVVKFVPMKSGS